MAIDETGLPSVMPAAVPRVTADGKPTKFLIDWEEGTRNWYLVNAIKTDQKITTVEARVGDAEAAIVVETNARVSADEALAEQITTVTASVGKVSAQGQVYFAAKATPAGAAAAYGLYLTAGDSFAGFEALAQSGGGSAIGFRANQFVFTDDGTQKNVFTYTGGQFLLTGNVAVDGNLLVSGSIAIGKLGANSVQTSNVLDNAITNVATGSGGWQGATASISCRAGDRILATVTYSPDGPVVSSGPTTTITQCFLRLNGATSGTNQKSVLVFKFLAYVSVAGDGSVTGQVHYWLPTTRQFVFIAPSTGTHTITATACGGAGESECFLTVMALSK